MQGEPLLHPTDAQTLQFQDSGGNNMTCGNNCKGVDPNSVIIGGTALLAVASVGWKDIQIKVPPNIFYVSSTHHTIQFLGGFSK